MKNNTLGWDSNFTSTSNSGGDFFLPQHVELSVQSKGQLSVGEVTNKSRIGTSFHLCCFKLELSGEMPYLEVSVRSNFKPSA